MPMMKPSHAHHGPSGTASAHIITTSTSAPSKKMGRRPTRSESAPRTGVHTTCSPAFRGRERERGSPRFVPDTVARGAAHGARYARGALSMTCVMQ